MEADCKHQNLALLLLEDGGGSMARNEGGLWKLSELGPQPTAREAGEASPAIARNQMLRHLEGDGKWALPMAS